MKVCPKCNQQYDDNNLNFCLSDGELLTDFGSADSDATPTVFLDAPRTTARNWEPANPVSARPNQDQQIFQQPFTSPQNFQRFQSQDKTLATVSLITGIMSLLLMCCYLGVPLGAAAIITGYLGLNKANSDPSAFGGKEMAIIGMVLGGISLVLSMIFIILWILGVILG